MKIRILLPVLLLLFGVGCKKADVKPDGLVLEGVENGKPGGGGGGGITYGTMRDIDGNEYKTVKIGTQVWMAENLKVSRYRNGASITNLADNVAWSSTGTSKTGAWCYYNNDAAYNSIYGKIYNGYAVRDSRGLAPKGWHIPTLEEWTALKNYLNSSNDGGMLKATILWSDPNSGATNSTGFSALPGGVRGSNGVFLQVGYYGYWYSSSLFTGSPGDLTDPINNVALDYNQPYLRLGPTSMIVGISVRCIKDAR